MTKNETVPTDHAARGRAELREQAEAAMDPCERCGRTIPHAFEDPNGHTWDPSHMTVRPSDVLAALCEPSFVLTDEAMRDVLVVLPPPADFTAYADEVRERLVALLSSR